MTKESPTSSYEKNKPQSIQAMFGNIAKNYDRGNAILSMQMHKYWNHQLIKLLLPIKANATLLDLCSGTGDIAFAYLKHAPSPQNVIILDFCREMLEYGKRKASHMPYLKKHHLEYIEADAQQIPLDNHSVDNITVAYGIRNIQDPEKCIQESYRVLKPGGTFAILELTRPNNSMMRLSHSIYLKCVIPSIGRLITSDKKAYQYLCKSIQEFISPEKLEHFLLKNRFRTTEKKALFGGIATIVKGIK